MQEISYNNSKHAASLCFLCFRMGKLERILTIDNLPGKDKKFAQKLRGKLWNDANYG
uniref:Uncharacterized protein n=1 Tax=Rhizophora mucronata TaxID=61149 RepID=A0A2P2QSB5_RHIMU